MTLSTASPVSPAYRHVDKEAIPARSPVGASRLKWYDIREHDREIGTEVRDEAHAAAAELVSSSDAGFVLLHLCGDDFYFLLINRWRNENELWETVLAKSGSAPFAAVQPEPTHATFCVWELAVVNAERLAWIDYLRSGRNAAAFDRYQASRFEGSV